MRFHFVGILLGCTLGSVIKDDTSAGRDALSSITVSGKELLKADDDGVALKVTGNDGSVEGVDHPVADCSTDCVGNVDAVSVPEGAAVAEDMELNEPVAERDAVTDAVATVDGDAAPVLL